MLGDAINGLVAFGPSVAQDVERDHAFGAPQRPHPRLGQLQRFGTLIEDAFSVFGSALQTLNVCEAARRLAGLGREVTPHTLKHTCIAWMLQKGVPVWEVAGFTGTSEAMISQRYGHHCPDHMENAGKALRRRQSDSFVTSDKGLVASAPTPDIDRQP